MQVTYIENVTREVTVDLKEDEEGMDISEIDSDEIIRDRVFNQAAFGGWDAEEVHESNWEINKYE